MGVERDGVVVGVAGGGTEGEWRSSLASVLAHTSAAAPILVCGAGETTGDRVAGRADSVAAAMAAAAPADFALVRAPCIVAEGWLEGLRDAARADVDIATATALAGGDELGPSEGMTPTQAAAAVAGASTHRHPRLGAAGGHCAYIRRSALELVGGYDPGFSERCVTRGLRHVLADDVLVGGVAPGQDASSRRAAAAARRALHGLEITIDARNLDGPLNGTRVHVLELIAALARTGEARITAIVPAGLDAATRGVLAALPGVRVTAAPGSRRADLVHRPFQIAAPADLAYLAPLADRLVVTHQDLISYASPGYFPDAAAWEGYRRLTRDALALADRVLFFSARVREEAIAEDLVEPGRASVVHLGVDHAATVSTTEQPGRAPPGAESVTEFMLCLGTDFQHKNRLFALEVLEQLHSRQDWEGQLVLAGPPARYGSSAPDERRWLADRRALAPSVLTLGAVSESQKAWLLRHAALVLYPTVSEGFGLIPFEAAAHGVPCLWAAGSALRELLPEAAAGIVPWDAAASAARALALMRDEDERAANLEAIRGAGAALRWDATARRLLEVYRSVCDDPPAPAGARARADGLMREGLSEDGVRLVGPAGALPRELERPLLALATHPRVSRPAFAALKAGYRAWTRLRERR